MASNPFSHGSFTLPGEAGYEDLTQRLAETWGADTIRDSDGTQLSPKITESGYNIYSTLCLVRADNEWAKANAWALQQTFLMSFPVTAESETVTIDPLAGYFREQLRLNLDEDPKAWWQVHDRTTGQLLAPEKWSIDTAGIVTIEGAARWHRYTVNFLAYRIWDEISMYNHVTNDWGDREHLMPLDPIHAEAREHILAYLDRWLAEHPHTAVVRFTSMFYNFFWPWGDGQTRRFVLNDWGSYEFSVSPEAIRQFEKLYGYRPTAEDFVNGGRYCSSHAVPSKVYRDWMAFIQEFVADFSKVCVDRVKAAGKQAYVFYNDHWIGLEPTLPRFQEIGFDGIIDGIFSGFETRKVAETEGVAVRELRFHLYFFPTGVNGAPSFLPGGDPTLECQTYWLDIRRALLRKPCDRMGFGGYLHLVENHPSFVEYVQGLAAEFRRLKSLHADGPPTTAPLTVAFLTAWGQQRAWGCCGHFNRDNYYNEAMESVSGLPVEVRFVSFEDLLDTGAVPEGIDVLINAGSLGDAWSGGDYWRNPQIVEIVSAFVGAGGGLVGIGEPTAAPSEASYFQLAHVFGLDHGVPATRAHAGPDFTVAADPHFITADLPTDASLGKEVEDLKLLEADTTVLLARDKAPRLAVRSFGRGRAVYLAGHRYNNDNVRLLHRALCWAAGKEATLDAWTTTNPATECAHYPQARQLVVVNNTFEPQETAIHRPGAAPLEVTLDAGETQFIDL
ncbi:MAG: 1,3-beta-galactosyl-N-acetylhexosamine phosphorylase [Opitutales bacterium]